MIWDGQTCTTLLLLQHCQFLKAFTSASLHAAITNMFFSLLYPQKNPVLSLHKTDCHGFLFSSTIFTRSPLRSLQGLLTVLACLDKSSLTPQGRETRGATEEDEKSEKNRKGLISS